MRLTYSDNGKVTIVEVDALKANQVEFTIMFHPLGLEGKRVILCTFSARDMNQRNAEFNKVLSDLANCGATSLVGFECKVSLFHLAHSWETEILL